MIKTATSPVAGWPGTIWFDTTLTYPQYCAWDEAVQACVAIDPEMKFGEIAARPDLFSRFEGAIFGIVLKWDIPELDYMLKARQLPATPREDAVALAMWLINEIYQVVMGETTVPNG